MSKIIKSTVNKAITKIKVTFEICPKCGHNTLGSFENHKVCVNCE